MGKDRIHELSQKWEDMDKNILMSIFTCLSVVDVVQNITLVCQTWLAAAKDHLSIMKSLDLSNVNKKAVMVTQVSPWPDVEDVESITIIPNPTMNISYGNFTSVVFGPSSFAEDAHLLCAAQRCPNLKRLVLPFLPDIADVKLAAAFKLWPKLESVVISFRNLVSPVVIESIGQNCKELKSLKFWTKHFLKDTACIITSCLPNLRILSFRSADIRHEAVLIVMQNLKNLEEMYIAHMAIRFTEPYGSGRTLLYCLLGLYQNEAIVQEALRLQKFHICRVGHCNDCPNQLDDITMV